MNVSTTSERRLSSPQAFRRAEVCNEDEMRVMRSEKNDEFVDGKPVLDYGDNKTLSLFIGTKLKVNKP
jgi:ribosomal protein S18